MRRKVRAGQSPGPRLRSHADHPPRYAPRPTALCPTPSGSGFCMVLHIATPSAGGPYPQPDWEAAIPAHHLYAISTGSRPDSDHATRALQPDSSTRGSRPDSDAPLHLKRSVDVLGSTQQVLIRPIVRGATSTVRAGSGSVPPRVRVSTSPSLVRRASPSHGPQQAPLERATVATGPVGATSKPGSSKPLVGPAGQPLKSLEQGHPTGHRSGQVGRVHPNHPAAVRLGIRWGSIPRSSLTPSA